MFDDFDLTIQCDELAYEDIKIEDVTINDIPLDGAYLEYLISTIPE